MSDLGNKKIMGDNIRRLLEEKGIMSMDICDELNIPYSTFSCWLTGTTYPRIDKIEKMANYFGVSKSDLVEEYHEKVVPEYSSDQLDLIEMYSKLTEKQKQQVLALLHSFTD